MRWASRAARHGSCRSLPGGRGRTRSSSKSATRGTVFRPRRWNGSSILSSPPSPTGWEWDSPSAARSWSPMVAVSGRWRTTHGEPSSSSRFRRASPIPIQKRESRIARWQAEEEDRSARRVFHRPQLSAVGFDDRAGDRESDAHPRGLRGVERLEHVLGGLSVEPLAGVLHIDDDLGSLERARTDRYLPVAFASDQGFQSVLDQVQDDLLDLDAVGQHGRQVLRQSRVERNVLLLCFAPHQRDDSENDLVQVEELFLRCDLLDQPPNAADDVAGPLDFLDDSLQSLSRLGKVGLLTREPSQ